MSEPVVSGEFVALQRVVAGKYSLVRELGRGGMGVVFLARDLALERLVAIKMLPPELARQANARERFLREARMAAALAHPNIVPIHAVEWSGDVVYFVMTFVDGESLGECIRRRGPLSAAEVLRVTQEVAWALAHAHARGIVHRDVKPDNILLERESGRALVTDFGIASATSGATPVAGGPAGTPHYLSPEVARGEPADARSDLYALGVTAWYALTGTHPFDAPNVPALLVRQASEDAPAVATVAPGVPLPAAAAIDRCLARAPSDRWVTAEAFAAALDRIRARVPVTPPGIRAYLRDVLPAGNDIGMAGGGAVLSVGMLSLLRWLDGGTGISGALSDILVSSTMLALGAVFGGLGLVRFGSVVLATRDLVAHGHDHAAVDRALREAEAERLQDEAALPEAGRRRRALMYGGIGTVKAGLALGLATIDDPAWLALPAAVVAVVLAMYAARSLLGALPARPSLWNRLLRGGLGRALIWSGRLFGGRRGAAAAGATPTIVALGEDTAHLFHALPGRARQELRALPGVLASLRDEAERLRRRDDAVAAERLEVVAAAIEALRLDLLEMSARLTSDGDVTSQLDDVRRISRRIDAHLRQAASGVATGG